MKTKIFLIRHGQTERNKEGIFTGQEDSPLTDLGLKQSEATGKYLEQYDISSIYSSDLGRTYRTARIISENINIKPKKDKRLRENNLGLWKGLNMSQLESKKQELLSEFNSLEYVKPPEGESTFDHRERVVRVLNDIALNNIGKSVIIVAHSGTNKIILSYIKGSPINKYYSISQGNCCINKIEYSNVDKKFKIIRINYTNHLKNLE